MVFNPEVMLSATKYGGLSVRATGKESKTLYCFQIYINSKNYQSPKNASKCDAVRFFDKLIKKCNDTDHLEAKSSFECPYGSRDDWVLARSEERRRQMNAYSSSTMVVSADDAEIAMDEQIREVVQKHVNKTEAVSNAQFGSRQPTHATLPYSH